MLRIGAKNEGLTRATNLIDNCPHFVFFVPSHQHRTHHHHHHHHHRSRRLIQLLSDLGKRPNFSALGIKNSEQQYNNIISAFTLKKYNWSFNPQQFRYTYIHRVAQKMYTLFTHQYLWNKLK